MFQMCSFKYVMICYRLYGTVNASYEVAVGVLETICVLFYASSQNFGVNVAMVYCICD